MIRYLLPVLLLVACGGPTFETVALCGNDGPIDSSVAPPDVAPDSTPDSTPDAPPDSPPAPRKLTLIMGQSNAVGPGFSSDLPDPSLWPFPAVALDSVTGQNATSDPPAWTTYTGPLAPRYLKFGNELTLGRAMADRDVAICAVNGASLAVNWNPYGTWPTGPQNLYQKCVAFAHDLEASHGVRVETIIWIQGESDIKPIEYANAYGANLTQISQLFLAEFPCARFVYNRLHSSGNGATLGYYSATVRAGQDAASSGAWMTMVNADALPMSGQHFTATGLLQLGELFASTIAGLTPRCGG